MLHFFFLLRRSWWVSLLMVGCLAFTATVLGAAEVHKPHPKNLVPAVVPHPASTPRVVEGTGSSQSVFLGGDFIEVGIHNAGSFGAEVTPPTGFHPEEGQLGFIVDEDGWDVGAPPKVGDFFVPGTPEEVWGVEWTSGSVPVVLMNAGLVEQHDIPTDSGYPTDVSAGDDRRSIWRGVASYETGKQELTITQTVSFRKSDQFFVINVVLQNTGGAPITGLKYLRSVDPDHESSSRVSSPTSHTENYVLAQPKRGVLPEYPLGNVDRALVVGRGITTQVPLGLGTIDKRARVSHGGFTIRSASAVLDLGVADGQLSDTGREGSTEHPGTPSIDDEAISLAFDLGSLAVNQSVSIDYAYILKTSDLEVALGQLARVTILQPTGDVSGTSALFQVSTNNPDSATVNVDFYVAGIFVGSDDEPSRTGTYEITFNTLTLDDGSPLPNGPVTIEAVATFANESVSRKSATVNVDNAGPPIAFSGSTPANSAVVVGSVIPIEVIGLDGQNPPFQVSIFREAAGTSIELAALDEAPFIAYMDVTDLPEGTVVAIKAVATDRTNTASTTIVRSVVSAVFPPGEDTTVTAPTLPLSQGNQTIYVAVSPSTPQGRTSLLATLTGSDNTVTRAFTWDPTIESYVERPSSPVGGIQVSTGIFIATRVPLSYSLDGTSIQAPFTLTLPAHGWVFAGVPPIDTGDGILTEHSWADTQIWLGGQLQLDDTTDPTLAEAMGNPDTPADSDSARPYFWNGTRYEQVDVLDTGKAYWFKNNLSLPLTLVFGQLDVAIAAAKAVKGPKVSQVPVQIRNQGTPPPPPSGKSKASSSSGGGCGVGSGIASLAFLMLMIGFRFLVVRR